ncbi:MAG TPA: molybdopterin-dependent oxidoreductase [Chloroflexota bacterium]|nr:molybdopterin-dependent oxidoreductase [Chloroflexota bacterium]
MDQTRPQIDRVVGGRHPEPVEKTYRLGRGAFLGLLGVTAGALVVKRGGLPKLDFVPGATSAYGFTIYTVTGGYPSFDPATYRLIVDGLVRQPYSLSLADILRQPAVEERRFYQCVTGWQVPNARWTGIRLSGLLARAEPLATAHAVKFYCFDGVYTESLTLAQANQSDVLLAYKLMGKPLSRAQGAPLRLVVPGMYGYKFAKWVYRIELIQRPIDGYWEQNGYDRDAYIGASNGV